MIVQEYSIAIQAVIIFLAVILTLGTIIGNGSFLAILVRFKVFRRNFTNILVAALAVVDCLNTLFNVPLFTIYFLVDPRWLRGKVWAIIFSSLHMEFNLLILASMSALMLDRFLAVYLGVKYFTWKTTKKAKIAVFLMWLVSTIVVVISTAPLFDMDLENVPLGQSKRQISQERKLFTAPIMAFFTLASTVLGILTWYAIQQKKKERIKLNLPPLAAEARLKTDIKATHTIVMAVAMYYICHIPIIALSIWRRRNGEQSGASDPWWAFIIFLSSFVSGALKPVVYILRNRRNRSAMKQFLNDPCGTSAYRENSVRKENKAEQRQIEPPQIKKEELNESRDPEAGPNPGSDPRRPTSIKIQIHQANSILRIPLHKNEDSGSMREDEKVAVPGESRWGHGGGDKVEEEEEEEEEEKGNSSVSVRDKEKECKKAPASTVRADPNPVSNATRPTLAKIQVHRSHNPLKMALEKKEDSGSVRADEQVAITGGSKRSGEKVKDEKEGESSGSVCNKDEECNRAPVKTLRADTNHRSDARRPSSAKNQIHQSNHVVKVAWKKNEEDSGSLPADKQVSVGGESRWAGEKIRDEEGESSGSVRDKNKEMKAAGRKGIGTFDRVKVGPASLSQS